MRVFVTGASGWIGSAVVDELLAHDHEVLGLARSEASATALEAKGAAVLRGDLDDLDALRRGAADTEATVHLANKHDFDDLAGTNRAERAAVEALAETLAGSDRPFVLASGVQPSEEDDSPHVGPDSMRGGSERLALDYVDRGVRTMVARFAPTTHGLGGDHGFIRVIAEAARRTGWSAYVGDGSHSWSAVHRTDAARLVRLGLERGTAGTRLQAAAENVPTRSIAEAIGARLGLPVVSVTAEEAADRLGFIGMFFGRDVSASSRLTRERFGWEPTGPTLLEDIAAGGYDA
jgi:nucleoside-diphosphate-sugar epimerase